MEVDEVYAPTPVRSSLRACQFQRNTNFLRIDIPFNERTSYCSIKSPSSVSSSTSSLQDTEVSFSAFESGLEQEQSYEEIIKILSNNVDFEEVKTRSMIIPQPVARPNNPFYKNFEKEDE